MQHSGIGPPAIAASYDRRVTTRRGTSRRIGPHHARLVPPHRLLRGVALTAVAVLTLGVSGVDLEVRRGELVLLLGQVGSGKSSLLASLAGLMEHTGSIRWNGRELDVPGPITRAAADVWRSREPELLASLG